MFPAQLSPSPSRLKKANSFFSCNNNDAADIGQLGSIWVLDTSRFSAIAPNAGELVHAKASFVSIVTSSLSMLGPVSRC